MSSIRRFEDSRAWSAAADLAVAVDEFCRQPVFVGRGSLRNQLERATLSISNNIAEGFERGTSNELLQFLYIARGSAGEVRSMLAILLRIPEFQGLKSQVSSLISEAEAISKQLYAWCQSVQNSPEVKGHRHLTSTARAEYQREQERIEREIANGEFFTQMRREHEEMLDRMEAERRKLEVGNSKS